MRLRRLFPAFALGAATLGCRADTNLVNPNTATVATFWKTSADATAGVTAAYQSLTFLGTFQRWRAFNMDIRSDIGTSFSPWTDLANESKFNYVSYDFPTVGDTWRDSFTGVSRANQVLAYVPSIQMDTATKTQYLAEAKFLRGLHYYNLITLYGGNIPLFTQPAGVNDRPGPAGDAAIWAQMEKDFTDAAAVLPVQTMAVSNGHATKGSAQGMLGKTLLQERKWSAAAAALQPIIQGQVGSYSLVPKYADLFNGNGNNTPESLFEVQFGNPNTCNQGACGLNFPKMIGACGPTWCDGRPTQFLFSQFLIDSTADGKVDPRLNETLFYYQGPNTMVHGLTWAARETGPDAASYKDTTVIYWKKYSEYYDGSTNVNWDAPLNFKVVRLADVYLMYAEALNEQGQTAAAATYVNKVRARVNVKPVSAGLSQSQMRDAIMKERVVELALEGSRWNDMQRQQMLTAANLPTLIQHDGEFQTFVPGKSDRLPIPTTELNLNPSLKQNPGW